MKNIRIALEALKKIHQGGRAERKQNKIVAMAGTQAPTSCRSTPRPLLKVAIIVTCWLIVIGVGLTWLDRIAARLERLPVYHYSQLTWSPDESKLAFVRTTVDPGRSTGRRELWYTRRVGDEAQIVAPVDSPLIEVLAWVAGVPGLILSYIAWAMYAPLAWRALRDGRQDRRTRAATTGSHGG